MTDYQEMRKNEFVLSIDVWVHNSTAQHFYYQHTFINYNKGLAVMNLIPPNMPTPIDQWVQENLPPADNEYFGKCVASGGSPTPNPDKGGNDNGGEEDNRGSGRRNTG